MNKIIFALDECYPTPRIYEAFLEAAKMVKVHCQLMAVFWNSEAMVKNFMNTEFATVFEVCENFKLSYHSPMISSILIVGIQSQLSYKENLAKGCFFDNWENAKAFFQEKGYNKHEYSTQYKPKLF